MKSKQYLKQKYQQIKNQKNNQDFQATMTVRQIINMMENSIQKQLQPFSLFSFTICGSNRKNFKVSPQLQSSFNLCNLSQKIQYYELTVSTIIQKRKQTSIAVISESLNLTEISVKIIKGVKIQRPIPLKLNPLVLDCKNYQIALDKYLLRKSKKQPNTYLFEAFIKKDNPSSIRFTIISSNQQKQKDLYKASMLIFQQFIISSNKSKQPQKDQKTIKISKNLSPTKKNEPRQVAAKYFEASQQKNNQNKLNESVVYHLIKQNSLQINEEEGILQYIQNHDNKSKSSKQIYHQSYLSFILPNYDIKGLNIYSNYFLKLKNQQKKFMIYCSGSKYRAQFKLPFQKFKIAKILGQIQNYKLWNTYVNQSQLKLAISSDNSLISYMKFKSPSQWYRQRDILFLRHFFIYQNACYFIDKSVQHPHFIPFSSIHRAVLNYCVTRIMQVQSQSHIIIEIDLDLGGLLTFQQKQQIIMGYLQGLLGLKSFIQHFNGNLKQNIDYNWKVDKIQQPQRKLQQNFESITSAIFNNPNQAITDYNQQSGQFYSINSEQIKQVHEITPQQLNSKIHNITQFLNQKIQLTPQGYSILPKKYLTTRHQIKPKKVKEKRKTVDYTNMMIKNSFIIDKSGGMLLVDKSKIAAQDNVLKFIMSTLKKNLFSGKGILNISLPVQIFNIDSNIQRLAEGMGLAPDLIQNLACKTQDPIQKFNYCVAFCLSQSILYFDIDKAFNPILGQTYQGIIDGCPVYGQQISHHPPISSILFIGRGYRVYANIQAKVYVHINSGQGVNEGLYTIQFDSGQRVMFQTAPGQVSGFTIGDRKYKIKGKSYIIDPKNRLFCAINFEDQSGFLSNKKWKFSDQMDGSIVKVSQGFVQRFFQQTKQKIIPSKKQIEQEYGKISGRWVQKFFINEKQYYNTEMVPHDMIHYEYPLNSNSNYREDLIYRKKNDLARSQIQKQRLQIIQRNDRKLRKQKGPAKQQH